MNIVISLLIGIVGGGALGFVVAVLMAAAGREEDQDVIARLTEENTQLRLENQDLRTQLLTTGVTLSATRDREQMLEEISREMNQ